MRISDWSSDVCSSDLQSFDEAATTDFAELSGTFTIDKGIVSNKDLSLVAPLVRMTGEGQIPLPPRTVDYVVKPKLVGTIEGQGGASDLSGVTVPIKVSGPWSDISDRKSTRLNSSH